MSRYQAHQLVNTSRPNPVEVWGERLQAALFVAGAAADPDRPRGAGAGRDGMSGGDRLDEAWERAEAALPPNWSIHALSIRPGLRPEERWETSAWGRERTDRAYCYGPDPANALRVLAEYLIGLAVGAA